jgi:dephospho-CoA kinase
MIILGLTGSIGMGKSTTASLFAEEGVPVYDADAAVHLLYAPGGAGVAPVSAAFPGVEENGAINREKLGAAVFGKPEEIRKLEMIVHPLVRQAQTDFLKRHLAEGAKIVVLDIPLLLEGGGKRYSDAVVVVSAPADVQRARVLARPGMTEEKFEAILAKQMPDADKRKHADFIINTAFGVEDARMQIRAVLEALRDAA